MEAAARNAVGIGGTLAVIDDQGENHYIVDTYKNNSDLNTEGNGGNVAWIGVTYDDSRNVFINALGENQSYFNWYPWFDSSVHPRGSSFCDVNTTVLLDSPYNGKWDDSWENQNVPYYRKGIAEIPLSYQLQMYPSEKEKVVMSPSPALVELQHLKRCGFNQVTVQQPLLTMTRSCQHNNFLCSRRDI